MDRKRPPRHDEDWDEWRARMIAETAAWITEALAHPEMAVRIPVIQAGQGEFPPSMSAAFWEPVLRE